MMSNIELFAALSKAQAEIKGAVKDSTNPHFKSRYADLESVIEAVKQPFFKFGLSFVQSVEGDALVTTICHASGGTITSRVPLIIGKNDMQGVGSAITYARRYGLAAAAGVSQTDDDGVAACEAPRAMHSPAAKQWATVGDNKKPLPVEKVPEGLLTDGKLETEYKPMPSNGRQFAAGPYDDNDDSKKWLSRELAFYGVHGKLASFKAIAQEVHASCLGKSRPEAQKIIAVWCETRGFKKG
jgi:hypothetical protein